MVLKNFEAENFRNIASCSLSFDPGVNVLIGENAQGKTNVVEGIYLFSRGRSFRAREDREMIRFGEEGFRVAVQYEKERGSEKLEYILLGKERRRKKNGHPLGSVAEMMGNFRSVLFSPDDLGLVKDGPEERRAFLNVAVAQAEPTYLGMYTRYKAALENRNCLLKAASKGQYIDGNEFYSWSKSMAEYASYIYEMRKNYIARIEKHAKHILAELSDGEEKMRLRYVSDLSGKESEMTTRELIADGYLEVLTAQADRERAAGTSLFGPHRDDMEIRIGDRSARAYASQGQQRSVVLALKLAEGEVIREIYGEYPVFLFDDVLSELDEKRRQYLFDSLGERQIIITTCEKENVIAFAGKVSQKVITVKEGNYQYE